MHLVVDGEIRAEIPRVSEKNDVVVVTGGDIGDLDLMSAVEDAKVACEGMFKVQKSIVSQHYDSRRIGDLRGSSGDVPCNVVSLPNEPDSPCMRVGDWGNEDVSQVDGESGDGGQEGGQSDEEHCHEGVHCRKA